MAINERASPRTKRRAYHWRSFTPVTARQSCRFSGGLLHRCSHSEWSHNPACKISAPISTVNRVLPATAWAWPPSEGILALHKSRQISAHPQRLLSRKFSSRRANALEKRSSLPACLPIYVLNLTFAN